MNLQLPLIGKWFVMTQKLIKKEDYRSLNAYWYNRLCHYDGKNMSKKFWELFVINNEDSSKISFKPFTKNTLTLGYPSSADTERIIKFKHAGIEIRTGNTEWGAEPDKLYFVIKHGEIIS